MPGHKGQAVLGCEPWDITEIAGADELYDADGIIAESEANAAILFGTRYTSYSTEGSSQCIRAMLFLALQAAPKTGQRPVLIAARNAHKALLYAAALLDFDIVWLWPSENCNESLCTCRVTAEQLSASLAGMKEKGRIPFGVYVTSPDYLGTMQNIAALAAVCSANNTILLVDNAHGAYLPFLSTGSRHPIALGAAMCCDSGHKTLPVLTGGAYLHLGENAPIQDPAVVRGAMALFGSTSPSYLILQSLDICNALLAGDWPKQLEACISRIERIRSTINKAAQAQVFLTEGAQEPLKLTLDAAVLGRTGLDVAACLRQRNIECEYADPHYVVFMPSPSNTYADFDRLESAIIEMVKNSTISSPIASSDPDDFAALAKQTKKLMTIRRAFFAPQEILPSCEAEGRVCAMPTVSCPPAIPIVVSGEEISAAAIDLFERYGIEKVAVVRE